MTTKYSMYPGRFQPFHGGHVTLVKKLLDEGRNVCIALRDTPLGEENPFTTDERTQQIRSVFPDTERVRIMVIPDIEEIVYGRKVGYGIRKVDLPPEIEAISATEIRKTL